MTPLERAQAVLAGRVVFLKPTESAAAVYDDFVTAIHTAIIEATNAEVEKWRAAEAECARLQRIIAAMTIQPVDCAIKIAADENYLRLMVWNPATESYWTIAATSEQPHVQGEVQRGKD